MKTKGRIERALEKKDNILLLSTIQEMLEYDK